MSENDQDIPTSPKNEEDQENKEDTQQNEEEAMKVEKPQVQTQAEKDMQAQFRETKYLKDQKMLDL